IAGITRGGAAPGMPTRSPRGSSTSSSAATWPRPRRAAARSADDCTGWRRRSAPYVRSCAASIGLEVFRGRVVEDERRDRCLGIHHEALGELHADLRVRTQQPPERRLIGQLGAGGLAERHTDPAIAALAAI